MQCISYSFLVQTKLFGAVPLLLSSFPTVLCISFAFPSVDCSAIPLLLSSFPTVQCRFFAFHSISNCTVRFYSVASPCESLSRLALPSLCVVMHTPHFKAMQFRFTDFLVLHHLLNFRRYNIRRQQLEDVGRRRSFVHIPMLDGSSRDAVLADKGFLR